MCRFFDSSSVLTKSVVKMTFSLAYVKTMHLLRCIRYHKNEIRKRAGDVISYTSLFFDRENVHYLVPSVIKGNVLYNFSVQGLNAPGAREVGGGGVVSAVFRPRLVCHG